MSDIISERYEAWLANATADPDLVPELLAMDDAAREDAFYRELDFGTGGLRGVIGAGTNRMNVYTVARASAGLADYVQMMRQAAGKDVYAASIAISYDSRIKSDLFSRVAAAVFASKGIDVWLYPRLMPTPLLSYAVRTLGCDAGVMITASHNPSKYNGYKVYGADGCQITDEAASRILGCIRRIDTLRSWMAVSYNEADQPQGSIEYIPEQVLTDFLAEIRAQSVIPAGADIDRSVKIVYSPLNGTGLEPVTRVLSEAGFTNITVVEEQREPDGNFPTCPYPNPEIREAMQLGMEYCRRLGADLLIATDPDCDRCGTAVRGDDGEYVLLSGNVMGLLLLDFVCSQRLAAGAMPLRPLFIKTIVTSDLAERIAAHYGVETVNVLTGFKYIGEQIGRLEEKGEEGRYVIGFEESYGYLSGTYVRDKDAVDASFLIAEMFAYYKSRGISLQQKLDEIYRAYGYELNSLRSYQFEGSAGFKKMQEIMAAFRGDIQSFGGKAVREVKDYSAGLDGLPKSDVIKFLLEDGCSVVVRPSGTEPKLKCYVSVTAADRAAAEVIEEALYHDLEHYME